MEERIENWLEWKKEKNDEKLQNLKTKCDSGDPVATQNCMGKEVGCRLACSEIYVAMIHMILMQFILRTVVTRAAILIKVVTREVIPIKVVTNLALSLRKRT